MHDEKREPRCDLEKSVPIPEMSGLKFKMTLGYLVSDRRQMPEALPEEVSLTHT